MICHDPPPRLRDWRAKGVSFPSVFSCRCFYSRCLLSLFFLSVLLLSVFTVGVYCRCILSVKRSKRDPPPSPALSRIVSLFGVEFKHRFWHPFSYIFLDFVTLLESILAPVSIIWALFFEHRFRINFSSILNRILISFFMFFMIFRTRTLTLPNLVF